MRQEQVNLASGLLILKMIMIEAENILCFLKYMLLLGLLSKLDLIVT
jgi:hypothetical protein